MRGGGGWIKLSVTVASRYGVQRLGTHNFSTFPHHKIIKIRNGNKCLENGYLNFFYMFELGSQTQDWTFTAKSK